jgi:arsenical pump membrane protein
MVLPSLSHTLPGEAGAAVGAAVAVTLPLICFLTAAICLTDIVAASGLVDRAAVRLARIGRGRCGLLFLVVCGVAAALTATLSLDGAVVVMTPLVAALGRVADVRREPLVLAVIAVANAASPALPQGNPTNLVVMARLAIGSRAFIAEMALPALAATVLCVAAVWLRERRALRARYVRPAALDPGPAGRERLALAALVAAAVAQSAAPWLGIAPWWPICAVAAATLAAVRAAGSRTPAIRVPWRIGGQVLAIATVADLALRVTGVHALAAGRIGAGPLLLVALAAAGLAALLNNLPASVVVAAAMAPGPAVYAALVGLSVGALATSRGSVATAIVLELTDRRTAAAVSHRYVRRFAPAAVAATLLAAAGLAAGW